MKALFLEVFGKKAFMAFFFGLYGEKARKYKMGRRR